KTRELEPGTGTGNWEPGTWNREPGTRHPAPRTWKPLHCAHAADIPDDTAAHWAGQSDWLVVRVCAGDRLCGGLLAGRGLGHDPVAGLCRVLPGSCGGGVLSFFRRVAPPKKTLSSVFLVHP